MIFRLALPILTLVLALGACRGVSRTLGVSGAVDVSPREFIERYEEKRTPEAYWVYAGRIGDHHYLEFYTTIDKTYPEHAGDIRVLSSLLPAGFPETPPGVPYPVEEDE